MEKAQRRVAKDTAKARAAKAAAAKAAATARANAKKKVHKAAKNARPSKQLAGFLDFIREQGVVGLAIGLVLGVQVKALVDQIIASFINPILGIILPGEGDLANKTFTITINGKEAIFAYGAFIAVFISFVVVAALVYFGFKALKLEKLDKKKD